MSRWSKIIFKPKKMTGSKTKVPKHGIDSGLECALKVFEQFTEDTGYEENSAHNLPGME